jgi:hypothetical protein
MVLLLGITTIWNFGPEIIRGQGIQLTSEMTGMVVIASSLSIFTLSDGLSRPKRARSVAGNFSLAVATTTDSTRPTIARSARPS